MKDSAISTQFILLALMVAVFAGVVGCNETRAPRQTLPAVEAQAEVSSTSAEMDAIAGAALDAESRYCESVDDCTFEFGACDIPYAVNTTWAEAHKETIETQEVAGDCGPSPTVFGVTCTKNQCQMHIVK